MANTPGNAPPSVNRVDAVMDATRQRLAPDQARFRQSQDPQIMALMEWLKSPEATEFLRRMVAQQAGSGGAAGPGSGGMPDPGPSGPEGSGPGGGLGGGPSIGMPGPGFGMSPPDTGGFGGVDTPYGRGLQPAPTGPGMGADPAPGVPGGDRDLSDPASFGPQGAHPLAGLPGAISGAFESKKPFFDERTGRTLYPGDAGYQQRDRRGQIVEELAAAQRSPQSNMPRFGPGR